MFDKIRYAIYIFVIVGVLSACQAIPATLEQQEAAPTSPATDDIDVQLLQLDELDTTFLAAIEADLRAYDTAPESRTYVALDTDGEVAWQGELHRRAERDVYWLQQAQGNGLSAVRLEAPTGSSQASIVAALPQPQAAGSPVDVQIEYVRAELHDDGTWAFDVTVRHPDMGWDDYADGWQIESVDSDILGLRILVHPHADEQPFTRTIQGVEIAEGISEVYVRAHDLVSGYGQPVEIPIQVQIKDDSLEVIR